MTVGNDPEKKIPWSFSLDFYTRGNPLFDSASPLCEYSFSANNKKRRQGPDLPSQVAVKEISYHERSAKEVLEEVKRLASITIHKHLSLFLGFYFDDNLRKFCFVTEMVTGGTLEDLMNRRRKEAMAKCGVAEGSIMRSLAQKFRPKVREKEEARFYEDQTCDTEEICSLMRQILAGLGHLHLRQGLAHGDLRPSNIMVYNTTSDPEVTLKLAYFGSSAGQEIFLLPFRDLESRLLDEYLAPELIEDMRRDKMVDLRPADVYAAGMIAYYLTLDDLSAPADFAAAIEFVSDRWQSHRLRDFIAGCLQRETAVRKTVCELQQHAFVSGYDWN